MLCCMCSWQINDDDDDDVRPFVRGTYKMAKINFINSEAVDIITVN